MGRYAIGVRNESSKNELTDYAGCNLFGMEPWHVLGSVFLLPRLVFLARSHQSLSYLIYDI